MKTPIIFTTAFDEYAIKAFKLNSVDYLLKPIDPKELKRAIDKFEAHHTENSQAFNMAMIEQAMNMMAKKYKERFVVKIGEHIHTIKVEDTAYFFSQDKATFLQSLDKKPIHLRLYT